MAVHPARAPARPARRHRRSPAARSSSTSTPPDGVTVETVGRDDARLGRTGAPVDRVAAAAWSAFTEATVVTVAQRGRARPSGRGSRCAASPPTPRPTGTSSSTSKPFAQAVVVLDHVGSATLADNVEVVVGDGATLTVVSLQDWADDAVHVAQHRVLVGRDARAQGGRTSPSAATSSASPRRSPTPGPAATPSCGPVLRRRGPAPRAPAVRRPRGAALPQPRHLQGRAAGRGRPHRLDRRRADPREGGRHRHLRAQPQPGAHRRRPRRLGAEPRDRDRRGHRRRPRQRHRAVRRRAAVLPAVARHPRRRGAPAGRARLLRRGAAADRHRRARGASASRRSSRSWRATAYDRDPRHGFVRACAVADIPDDQRRSACSIGDVAGRDRAQPTARSTPSTTSARTPRSRCPRARSTATSSSAGCTAREFDLRTGKPLACPPPSRCPSTP